MASSTIIARNIRGIRQSLCFYSRGLHYLTKTSPHTPCAHGLFHPQPTTSSQQEVICGTGLNYNPLSSFSLYQRYRYLSVGPTDSKEQVEKSEDKKTPEKENENIPESGAEEKSGSSSDDANAGKSVRGSPVSWISLLLLILTGAGVIIYFDKTKKQYIQAINEDANKTSSVKVEPSVGKAAVGGPFNLVDHHGKAVSEKDFKGKWSLIYFGFTHCPDICPEELQKLAAAIDKIKGKGFVVVPLFISVDPERDTVEQMRDYVKEFHPDIIGLTGSADDIKKVARSYRVYYMKTDDEDSDYLVDHSIVMYLMDPDMEFVKFFGKNEVVDTLAEGIIKEITEYKK